MDDGSLTAQWGGFGTDLGTFNGPSSLLVTGLADHVADTGNNRIQAFWLDGTFIESWGRYGTGIGEFRGPTGIARAPDGTIYVVDQGNSRVQ